MHDNLLHAVLGSHVQACILLYMIFRCLYFLNDNFLTFKYRAFLLCFVLQKAYLIFNVETSFRRDFHFKETKKKNFSPVLNERPLH